MKMNIAKAKKLLEEQLQKQNKGGFDNNAATIADVSILILEDQNIDFHEQEMREYFNIKWRHKHIPTHKQAIKPTISPSTIILTYLKEYLNHSVYELHLSWKRANS